MELKSGEGTVVVADRDRCWKRSSQQPFHYGKRTLRPWLQN